MAQFQNPFDATAVAPREPMDVLREGDYPVLIEASEWKETKKRDGAYLELTLQVTDGEYKGRKLWDRLNLSNPNTAAVDIAQQTLSAICHAVGVLKVSDSAQLHDKPMVAKVKVKQGENGPMNEIKGYKQLKAGVVGTVAPAPAAAAPAATAPWLQKKTA
jgi:hypothetical protein